MTCLLQLKQHYIYITTNYKISERKTTVYQLNRIYFEIYHHYHVWYTWQWKWNMYSLYLTYPYILPCPSTVDIQTNTRGSCYVIFNLLTKIFDMLTAKPWSPIKWAVVDFLLILRGFISFIRRFKMIKMLELIFQMYFFSLFNVHCTIFNFF